MIEPFSRKPTNAREWQLRAQVLQKQLEGLSIEELLRGGRVEDAPQISDGDGPSYDPVSPRARGTFRWRAMDEGRSQFRRALAMQVSPTDAIISDLGGDLDPGAAYANRRSRHGPIFINGRPVEISTGQANRLAEAEAQAREAISRVREYDPHWRPHPSAYGTVEGLISAHRADALQARSKFAELQQNGIVPGLYFREGITARGPSRDFRRGERDAVNELFELHGCHTCGLREYLARQVETLC